MALSRTLLVLAAILFPAVATAQSGGSFANEVFAGSEEERYLRLLQVAGRAAPMPWSIRPLSPRQVERLLAVGPDHPWAGELPDDPHAGDGLAVLSLRTRSFFNSAFPHGQNNGAVWAGRGLTAAVSGGAAYRAGPLSIVLAPTAFLSQNATFDTGGSGKDPTFDDPIFASGIDRPLRFGSGVYGRLDAGQSSVRLDAGGVALGISNANGVWGPADRYPLILGNNAPGFAHVFLGTSQPVNVRIGAVHTRVQWGALEQSRLSPMPPGSRRLMAGFVGAFTPAGAPGLEIGASRFYHLSWPGSGGWGWGQSLAVPFESLLKLNIERRTAETEDNQLAAVFLRWVLPASGVEAYAEYAREDHNAHLRDFILQPDHTSGFTLGARKVWAGDDRRWWALTGEVLNTARSNLVRVRDHGPFYGHHALRQGHTHRGQVLGSPAAVGGSGTHLRLDRYDAAGRWSGMLSREVQRERLVRAWTGEAYPEPIDVIYSLETERLLFRRGVEVAAGLGIAYNLDRYLRDDRTNFSASVGGRYDLGRRELENR
jgi:hypothetical protein